MSFPRYAKYKDSGVQGVGEVPEHWEARRLKSLVEEPLKYGANESAELDDRTQPRFVRITDIDDAGGLREETFKSLPSEIAAPFLLKEGDVLLARSGATVGKSFLYSKEWGTACFAGYLIRARLRHSHCMPTWLYYFCQTDGYWGYIVGSQIQATIQNVSAEKYANLFLPLPPRDEQSLIAAFLDRETAKIDALVAEQRRLIELLKQKRQAVISHAVTKGLNPHARMKQSGIEWLGDVPEHWEVVALKRIANLKSGESITGESIENTGEHPVLGGNGLRGYTSEFTHDGRFVVIGRQGALCGNINYTHGKFWASEHAVVASPLKEVETFWLGEMLRAMNLNQHSVSAAQPGLSMDFVGNLRTVFPPIAEQTAIATFLGGETARIDGLISEQRRLIDLLQERRTALISAAVTGKIDVRGLVETEAA